MATVVVTTVNEDSVKDVYGGVGLVVVLEILIQVQPLRELKPGKRNNTVSTMATTDGQLATTEVRLEYMNEV